MRLLALVESVRRSLNVRRAAADFFINHSDIFAEDAEQHEQRTEQEQHQCDDRPEAIEGHSVYESTDRIDDHKPEGQRRKNNPEEWHDL